MRPASRAVLLAIALATLAGSRPAYADGSDVHEDPDYAFRIRAGPEQTVMDEATASRLVPGALAGLLFHGTYHVLLVQRMAGADLDAWVLIKKGEMRLEDARFDAVESADYRSLPGRRWITRGRIQGVPITWRHLIFARGDFLFQVMSWTTLAGTDDLRALEDALELASVPIRPRTTEAVLTDQRGVHWRLHGGLYQDAAHAIEARAPDGWRLVAGFDASRVAVDAAVGFVARDVPVQLVVSTMRGVGVDPAQLVAATWRRIESAPDTDPIGASTTVPVGGVPFSFRSYRQSAQVPMIVQHAVAQVRDRVVDVKADFPEAIAAAARPRIEAVLGSIHFLDSETVRALSRELTTAEDTQANVGPGSVFRNGTWRDFDLGISWTRPPGFWNVRSGAEARSRDEEAALVMEEPSLGLQARLVVDAPRPDRLRETHERIVDVAASHFTDATRSGPAETRIDGRPAFRSEVHGTLDQLSKRFVMATASRGDRVVHLQVFGLEGNVSAAPEAVDGVLRGLRFVEGPAQEVLADALVDHRLGFRLRRPLGEGWVLRRKVLELSSIGTLVGFERGTEAVMVGAFSGLPEGRDPQIVQDVVLQAMQEEGGRKPKGTTTASLGGLPAQRLEFEPTPRSPRSTTWLSQRGRFCLFLSFEGPAEGLTDEQILSLFELLP